MALPNQISVSPTQGQTVKVSLQNQVLTSYAPVSLRNTQSDYNELDKLTDVDITGRGDGATLVYNAATDRYELKTIAQALPSLDGGTF